MDAAHMGADLEKVLITEEEIHAKLDELAERDRAEYEGKDLLLVGVLKGAVMVMADLSRALPGTAPVDWMAVSSYGSGTKSSRRRAHPQGPRHRHHRQARADRRGHRRLRA